MRNRRNALLRIGQIGLGALALLGLMRVQPAQAAPGDAQLASEFPIIVHSCYGFWDTDNDGALTLIELDRAIASPTVQGKIAAAVVAMRRPLIGDEAQTALRAEQYLALAAEPSKKGRGKYSPMVRDFLDAAERIENIDRRLFTKDGPRIENLHQGSVGDCYAIAALGAYTHRNPKDVKKLFKVHKDGTIHVAFPAGRAVDITRLTDGEYCVAGARSEKSGCWPRVFEKAIGKIRLERKPGDERIEFAAIAHGGGVGAMISLLTGCEIDRHHLGWARGDKRTPAEKQAEFDKLRGELKAAVAEHRLIGAGTVPREVKHDKYPGVVPMHAHAILHYDEATDLLTLWNPWGNRHTPQGPPGREHGYLTEDGIFRAPLTEAGDFLATIAIQSNRRMPSEQ